MTEYARVYGGSLYDLALEENLTDAILEQMKEVKEIFRENPDYLKLLSEPSIKKTERTDLIEKAFGAEAERYLVNFLKILCERNLLNEYESMVSEFTRRYNADHGIVEAVATSAIELTDEQKAALKAKLEKVSGKTVSLITKVNPALVAGLKVELEGVELDGSVSGRLSGISKKLSETKI